LPTTGVLPVALDKLRSSLSLWCLPTRPPPRPKVSSSVPGRAGDLRSGWRARSGDRAPTGRPGVL